MDKKSGKNQPALHDTQPYIALGGPCHDSQLEVATLVSQGRVVGDKGCRSPFHGEQGGAASVKS